MSARPLPSGWTSVSLEDLTDSLESGGRPKGGARGILEGVPSIGGEHITRDGTFDFARIKYVPEEFARSMYKGHLKVGDVLVVKDGATTGKVAIVGPSFPFPDAIVNEHVFACRVRSEANAAYVSFYLRSADGQRMILEDFRGAAQGGISRGFVRGVTVPLAPLPEQRRIVEAIEMHFARLGAAVKAMERCRANLRRYRACVLRAACDGSLLSGERGRWQPHKVGELLLSLDYGTSEKTMDDPTGIPVLRMGNIRDGRIDVWIDVSDLRYLPADHADFPKLLLRSGDLLFNRTNSPELVGKTAVYRDRPSPCSFASYLIRARLGPDLLPEFLSYCTNSQMGRASWSSQCQRN
jgi:type I restriction enzyme S subunit